MMTGQPINGDLQSVTSGTTGSRSTSTSMSNSHTGISRQLKFELCQALNPPNAQGNDWRRLAACLNIDRSVCINIDRSVCLNIYRPIFLNIYIGQYV